MTRDAKFRQAAWTYFAYGIVYWAGGFVLISAGLGPRGMSGGGTWFVVGALLVPQRAVQEVQGSYQVAVVGPDGTVDIREVKVGPRYEQLWVITDGVNYGIPRSVTSPTLLRLGARYRF